MDAAGQGFNPTKLLSVKSDVLSIRPLRREIIQIILILPASPQKQRGIPKGLIKQVFLRLSDRVTA